MNKIASSPYYFPYQTMYTFIWKDTHNFPHSRLNAGNKIAKDPFLLYSLSFIFFFSSLFGQVRQRRQATSQYRCVESFFNEPKLGKYSNKSFQDLCCYTTVTLVNCQTTSLLSDCALISSFFRFLFFGKQQYFFIIILLLFICTFHIHPNRMIFIVFIFSISNWKLFRRHEIIWVSI